MQKAPDFDRKMLLLATHIAHRSEMRLVLLSVLNNLLKTLKFGASGEIVVEAMTLLRCMIKLILGLLVDPTANRFVELHFQRPFYRPLPKMFQSLASLFLFFLGPPLLTQWLAIFGQVRRLI